MLCRKHTIFKQNPNYEPKGEFMKKWLLTAAMIAVLSACSTSNESKQQAGDTYQKSNAEITILYPFSQ